jgi:hypothetical protein
MPIASLCPIHRSSDRRQERTLAADPMSEKPEASNRKRGAAVRAYPMVMSSHASILLPEHPFGLPGVHTGSGWLSPELNGQPWL